MSAAGGAPIAILNHDEPTAYLVPAATYEWIMERLEGAELAEIVRDRQPQLDQAVEVDLNQLSAGAGMTYQLKLLPVALKEWEKLAPPLREQFNGLSGPETTIST